MSLFTTSAIRRGSSLIRTNSILATKSIAAFSTSSPCQSHIGSAPVTLPSGVTLNVSDKEMDQIARLRMELNSKRRGKYIVNLTKIAKLTGPRGELDVEIADFVGLNVEDQSGDDVRKVTVSVNDPEHKAQRSMWGTIRSRLNNGVIGVTEGHISILKFVGTGFRAALEKTPEGKEQVSLRVGYCVPIVLEVPEGLKIQLPLPHRMIIEGNDKQKVKQFAASIRKWRKPEPYKGKGIFVDGETIKLKARKIK